MDQQQRNKFLDILVEHTNPSELVQLSYQILGPRAHYNLTGNTHRGRCISFMVRLNQLNREDQLPQALARMRSDIDLSDFDAFTTIGNQTKLDRAQSQHQREFPPEDKTPGTHAITWLHISDLHFRESRSYDANIVLEELLKDIDERRRSDNLSPDLIVVTGDIAFSGHTSEYALAQSFFDKLLKTTKLEKNRLFLVPGNHDVDRASITEGAKAIGLGLQDRGKTNTVLGTPEDRSLLMARFEAYAEFITSYFADCLSFDSKRYFYVRMLEAHGGKFSIALLGLNSAWLCTSDRDKAEGVVVGERQVRAALDESVEADLRIALLHHPFDWLREFDRQTSGALLLDNCDFILHGHLHHSATSHMTSPDSSAMIIGGGACYKTREYPNAYNFVQVNLTSRTGTVYLRRYTDERGGFWTTDTHTYRNVPLGKYHFSLSMKEVDESNSQPIKPKADFESSMPPEYPYERFKDSFREIVAPKRYTSTGAILHLVFGDISRIQNATVAIPVNQEFDFRQRGPRSVLSSFEDVTIESKKFFDAVDEIWPKDRRPLHAGIGHTKFIRLPENSLHLEGVIFVVTTRNLSMNPDSRGRYVNTPIEGIKYALEKVIEITENQQVSSLAVPLLGAGYANIARTSNDPELNWLLRRIIIGLTIRSFEDHFTRASKLKRGIVVLFSPNPQSREEHKVWDFVVRFLNKSEGEKREQIDNLLQILSQALDIPPTINPPASSSRETDIFF